MVSCGSCFLWCIGSVETKDYKEVLSTKTKAAGELVGDIPCYIAG